MWGRTWSWSTPETTRTFAIWGKIGATTPSPTFEARRRAVDPTPGLDVIRWQLKTYMDGMGGIDHFLSTQDFFYLFSGSEIRRSKIIWSSHCYSWDEQCTVYQLRNHKFALLATQQHQFSKYTIRKMQFLMLYCNLWSKKKARINSIIGVSNLVQENNI